jgi:two-component system phosphate regulon sensor histidine kinase PhoR
VKSRTRQFKEEEVFRSAFDAISDSLHVIDRDFRVLLANKAYLELTKRAGYVIDPCGQILFEVYPFLSQKVHEEYLQVFETGQLLKTQEKNTIHSIIFYTETQKVPILEEGKVVRVLTVIRDISEWKSADIFKANLIAFAAHELKTPLIPILGWTDFIKGVINKGEDLNAKVERDALLSVIRNAERSKNIVDRYLDVGRIETGRLVLSIEQIDLPKLISEAIIVVSPLIKEKSIKIFSEIPSIPIQGDIFHLGQVFINLLSNAIVYSPPNTTVRIHTENSGERVTINIQDEGFGFSPQELENISQIFSRSPSTTKDEQIFTGSGVGLYMCQRVVEAHGGSLEVKSLGKNTGTTVSVVLLKNPPNI